jgi:hypothetical protein
VQPDVDNEMDPDCVQDVSKMHPIRITGIDEEEVPPIKYPNVFDWKMQSEIVKLV